MRIALVHDWLTGMRGGERVLAELCAICPGATVFTLFHEPGSVSARIESMPIRVSPLNRIPRARRHYRYWLPLYPWAISTFDLRAFDLIISSSHAVAKGVRKPQGVIHICWCHTPMRFVWDMASDYFSYSGRIGAQRAALALMKRPLRAWDRATSESVDYFVANSHHVQQRIAHFYGRESQVIYPPVDTGYFTPSGNGSGKGFYLVVSALVPYKRIDLAIEACRRLGRVLVVAGEGPDRKKLESRGGPGVVFKGFVTDVQLLELYRHCSAVIVPGREDFGLVSVEAQACGRPVIAYSAGGSRETVRDGETGILFHAQTTASLIDALQRFENIGFDREALRANAERFCIPRFRAEMESAVSRVCSAFSGRRTGRGTELGPGIGAQSAGSDPRMAPHEVPHPSLRGMAGTAKRVLDVLVSLLGLALLALPMGLVAWLIRRDSPGCTLYRQARLGLRGREFQILKLRTMHSDAEEGVGPVWARQDDPRCTQLGRVLRRYGLDELPQLWNVLKGDMSLVGPRPERPVFHAAFSGRLPGFERRLEVRAGITGRAQVRGWRGDTSMEERLKADLSYIEGWSFWQDLKILLQTPLSVLQPARPRAFVQPFTFAAERSFPKSGRSGLDDAPGSAAIGLLPGNLNSEPGFPLQAGSGAS